jgi:hypothetical protein
VSELLGENNGRCALSKEKESELYSFFKCNERVGRRTVFNNKCTTKQLTVPILQK